MSYGHPKPPRLSRATGKPKEDVEYLSIDPGVPAVVTPPPTKQTCIPIPLEASALHGLHGHNLSGGSWNCTKLVDDAANLPFKEVIFDGIGNLIPPDTIEDIATSFCDQAALFLHPPKIFRKRDSNSSFDMFIEDMLLGDFDSLDLTMNPPEIERLSIHVPETVAAMVPAQAHEGITPSEEIELRYTTTTKKPHVNQKKSYKNPKSKKLLRIMDMDVLLGRGAVTNRHPGNKEYHKQKAILQPSYLQATRRKDKTAIAQELVDVMQCSFSSRFLVQEKGVWCVVNNQRALEKAKQALRENLTPEERRAKRERYASQQRVA